MKKFILNNTKMKLTKENICVKNSKKNRELLRERGFTVKRFKEYSYLAFCGNLKEVGANYEVYDFNLIKHKHLKSILDGKYVQLVDVKVVVIEPEKPAELLTSEYGAELEIITRL